jgi:phosphatidylglycerol:prolipoprotein diacylglycerol transferase
MYPVLFTIPGLGWPISSFGAAMAVGFLVGYWIAIPRMKEEGLDPEDGANLLMCIMFGGVFGAKLYYATSFYLIHDHPFWESMFSRGGLVFYGGLIGGWLGGFLGCRYWKVDPIPFANSAAISLAVGQAIGRVGCFLVGDDYGRASDLPWAVAFPNGLPPVHYPVHPTMLYETLWLSLAALFLWRRRKASPSLFGEFLILNGVGRTVIEHWRLNARVALDLSEAQWIGMGLVVFGIALVLRARTRDGGHKDAQLATVSNRN